VSTKLVMTECHHHAKFQLWVSDSNIYIFSLLFVNLYDARVLMILYDLYKIKNSLVEPLTNEILSTSIATSIGLISYLMFQVVEII